MKLNIPVILYHVAINRAIFLFPDLNIRPQAGSLFSFNMQLPSAVCKLTLDVVRCIPPEYIYITQP